MIRDSVAFCRSRVSEVIYDAEHFFDAYKDNARYAMETVKAAVEAGADWVCLCDTNGGTMPWEAQEILRRIRDDIPVPLGIHAHNDSECAVALSLMAVCEGATMVQGTVNGYGERCGNANLCSIIPALVLKMDIPVVSPRPVLIMHGDADSHARTANGYTSAAKQPNGDSPTSSDRNLCPGCHPIKPNRLPNTVWRRTR